MTDEDKWNFLSEVPYIDAEHPRIERLARHLLYAAEGNVRRFVTLCHTVARDWIQQTSDTAQFGGEDIAGLTRTPTRDDAVDALDRGKDDCDAKARLFVALCTAGHVTARMAPRWSPCSVTPETPKGRQLTHVSAEVYIDTWQPVELTLARARLGEQGEQVPKENDTHHWRLA